MTGVVYFVRCEDYVKIGFSQDLKTRISDLQTACPYELELIAAIPGEWSLEGIFHNVLRDKRIRGEWFVLDDDLRQRISMMMKRLSCGRKIRIRSEGDVIALLDPRTAKQRSKARLGTEDDKKKCRAEFFARLAIKKYQ